MEDIEMKMVNIKARTGIPSVWAMPNPVKLIGAVALGTVLLVTAIGVPGRLIDAGAVQSGSLNQRIETFSEAEFAPGFLNQGQAGYSLEEQMEIAGTDTAPVSPKVERVNGFLNQGQAGYSLEEQMESFQE